VKDEIPLARRVAPPQQRRRGVSAVLPLASLVACGCAAVLAARGAWLTSPDPTDLNSLMARRLGVPDTDGRLFGHFPYAEAENQDLVQVDAEHLLHRDAAEAFLAMRDAASADGVVLTLLSAFRSVDLQESIFFDVMEERNQNARERALVSAPPGYSEHSTGFAIDLGDGRQPETDFSEEFEDTEAFRWLQQYALSFRFALSFPPDNPQGVSYEPWHWRYEGSVAALHLFEPAQRLEPPERRPDGGPTVRLR